MSRVSREFYDKQVNAQWPSVIPELTKEEALVACKKLWKLIVGNDSLRPMPAMKLTSGNRYTYTHRGTLLVNPTRGWKDMIHELSHCLHSKIHWNKPGHDSTHAYLERRMIQHVVSNGWLEGKLKPKPRATKVKQAPTKEQLMQARYNAVLAKIKRWTTKYKRANTALQKLARSKRMYERLLSA